MGWLSYHVFKFIGIILSKSPLPGDVDLPASTKLELGGLNALILVPQLGADGLTWPVLEPWPLCVPV